MANVPEKVLAWLYSVLHEYQDPQRTYSDVARTLSSYPSISPRTEVYTYENGASALLLTLSGTLPAAFRGTTYRFPVKVWIPQAYPQEAPILYVTAGRDILIRPGQHVGVDGRVYHPYLRDWSKMWDRASIAEFLEFMQQVFTKEPPVIIKAQQQQYQRSIGQAQPQQSASTSPIPPPLPPKQRPAIVEPADILRRKSPPPRPPKPGEEYADQLLGATSSCDVASDGPPLPPLPHERAQGQQPTPSAQYQNGNAAPPKPPSQIAQRQPPRQANGKPLGPPLPLLPQQQHIQYQQARTNHERSPVSPVSPMNGYSELPETKYAHLPPLPQQEPWAPVQSQPAPYQSRYPQFPLPIQQQAPIAQPAYHSSLPNAQQATAAHFPPERAPPRDLLSDPFDIALPASGPPAPAPPIPPNPEKEHLLHLLSTSLVQQGRQKVHQNLSAIAPLQAQQVALRAAHARLEAEIRHLEQLSSTLDSNESILHRSIQDCEICITNAKRKKQPPIDEVLFAPTLVGNQLWTLCAEEAACREAMYVLQTAVDRGRVSGEVFVRQMRGLGREVFLKMVLVRKCARGLGLEVR